MNFQIAAIQILDHHPQPFILPKLRNDPVIFPSQDSLRNAEIYLLLSPEGQALRDRVWEQFISAIQ